MSMYEKVQVEIARRRFEVEIEGLTPIEINHIANMVNEKLEDAQRLTRIADSSRLAIHVLLHTCAELYKIKQAEDTSHKALENTLDRIGKTLEQALTAVGSSAEAE